MCLRPQPTQGERESARSEVRHAGAVERPSALTQDFSKSLAKPEDVFSKACQGW